LSSERVQKPEDVVKVGDKVWSKVISINPVDRKIGLSVREYERDQDKSLMAEHGGDGAAAQVDVAAAMRGAVPAEMLQAGRSLEDDASEMMAVVSANAAAKRAAEADPVEAENVTEAPVSEPAPESDGQ